MNAKAIFPPVFIVGCGWLGQPLARELIAQGTKVTGTFRSPETQQKLSDLGIPAIKLNMGETLHCEDLQHIDRNSITVIALPPKARKGATDFPQKLARLLNALDEHQLHKVILISSTSVYPATNATLDETNKPVSDTHSGRIMLQAETLLRSQENLQTCIIRFAGLCGPDRQPGRFFAGKTDLPGGDCPVNLIQQDDCIKLVSLVLQQQPWGEIYNGCAPMHPCKREFYAQMARKQNLTLPQFLENDNSSFKLINADKACDELGMTYDYADPMAW